MSAYFETTEAKDLLVRQRLSSASAIVLEKPAREAPVTFSAVN